MKSRRKFIKGFTHTAVRRLEGGQSVAEVARALEVHPSDLYRRRRELQEHGERAFRGVGKLRAEESRVAAILRAGSPGFARRHAHPDEYLRRTLARAVSELQATASPCEPVPEAVVQKREG